MSTPYPPDPAQDPTGGSADPGAAAPTGPVRYNTGQPSFPYPDKTQPPAPAMPFAPAPGQYPGYPPAPPAGYPQPAPGYPQPAPGYPQAAPGYPPPVPGYPQPAPGYPSPAASYPQPAASYPQPASYMPQAVPAQAVPPPYPYAQPGATPQAWSAPAQASGKPKFIGLIIALAGGVATLVAFFALPLLNTGQLGQVGQSSIPQLGDLSNPSAFKVIGLLNQLAPLCQQSGDPNCSGFQLLGIGLWVPAIAAILAVLIAGLLWLTSASSHKRPAVLGSVGILVFSILGTLPLAFALVGLNAAASQIAQYGFGGSVSQLLGAGFWLMIVGLVVAVVGSITQMVVR